MNTTLSVIKADVGSIGGHIMPSRSLLQSVRSHIDEHMEGVISDFFIGSTGDDIAILMVHERGAGNLHNALLPPGSGGFRFRNTWLDSLLPALDAFRPQLVLVSAGFDAHLADPLADLMLDAEDFAWITSELRTIARRHASGRVVSMLEGGYHLDALAESAVAHVGALRD